MNKSNITTFKEHFSLILTRVSDKRFVSFLINLNRVYLFFNDKCTQTHELYEKQYY